MEIQVEECCFIPGVQVFSDRSLTGAGQCSENTESDRLSHG